jgi:cell wall-associated NlpC family hydrolase
MNKKILLTTGIALTGFGISASADEVKVKQGDTLSIIANQLNTTVDELIKINNIENPNLIFVDQIIKSKSHQPESTNDLSESTDNLNEKIINEAMKYIGTPYVWGGNSPAGFDCSGLVEYVRNSVGANYLGRTAATQAATLRNFGITPHHISQAKRGDLLFWGDIGGEFHMAIYLGNLQMIVAPQPGELVQISNVWGNPQAYSAQ